MDRIARIAKKVFLATYLNEHQQKLLEEQLRQGRREDYGPLFKDERTYFPMGKYKLPDIEAPHEIEQALSDLGYEITNYREGHAKKEGDRREFSIGKILQREVKDSSLKQKFDNRLGTSRSSLDGELACVITHKPEDVAAMSTNRNWKSCMELPESPGKFGGTYHSTALRQVSYGGMCAYLIDSDDREINSPYARIAIKRLESPDGAFMYRQEPVIYGDKDFANETGFWYLVKEKLDDSNRETMKNGVVFRMADPDSYSDGHLRSESFIDRIKDRDSLLALDKGTKLGIVRGGDFPEWMWDVFADDPDVDVRWQTVFNRHCPDSVFMKLSDDESDEVRHMISIHSNCPAEVLAKMAGDENNTVRRNVAQHRNCPAETLEKLSGDGDRDVRGAVAENPNCPDGVLGKLSRDVDYMVRSYVAKNPSCPADALVDLSRDKYAFIRNYVAKNPSCPAEALENLVKDESDKIREIAMKHPNYKP